jgi:hypothetical protein
VGFLFLGAFAEGKAFMAQITAETVETTQTQVRGTTLLPSERRLNHLQALEGESIYILREAAAEFERPVMLYSIDKDSSVMSQLAQKPFYSGSQLCASRAQVPGFARRNTHWLPWLAFPIGVESGFSSAGAGALGTVLLLNYSDMSPAEVVGTDVLFGLVLATIGTAIHWSLGSISAPILIQLLLGGIPGVILGCALSRKVPANKLKVVVAAIAICAGLQLVWSGVRGLSVKAAANPSRVSTPIAGVARP